VNRDTSGLSYRRWGVVLVFSGVDTCVCGVDGWRCNVP
jgi:hypothetical protein